MVASNPDQVANIVQRYLRESGGEGSRVRVLTDSVRPGGENGEWWYVPVSFQTDRNRLYFYYEMFSEVEERLEEHEKLNVLLVPRITSLPD